MVYQTDYDEIEL